MKNFPAYSLMLLLLILAGCNDRGSRNNNGEIATNSEKVNEHIISIEEATKFTARFRDNRTRLNRSVSSDPYFKENPFTLRNAEYFNRDAIAALLNQAGDNGGIRIYLGQDEKGTVRLVLVPATPERDVITRLVAKNQLTIPGINSANAAPFANEQAVERGQECPEVCPRNSPLNPDTLINKGGFPDDTIRD